MIILIIYCVKFCADIVLRGVRTSPNFIFQLHFAFMFCLVNLTTFALWTKNRSSNDEGFYDYKNFLKPLSILFLVLNYIITGVLSLFRFAPFKEQNLLAARTSNAQFLIFLSKAISAPFINFIHKEESHSLRIVLTVVLLLLSVTEFAWLIKSVPYFNYKIMKQAIVWSLISALISIANTLTVITNFSSRSMTSLLYVELVLFPLVVKQVISSFQQTIRHYTAASENQLKSQDEIFKKLLALSSIKEKLRMSLNTQLNADLSEAYFLGDLASHSENCSEQTCLCQQAFSLHQEETVTEEVTNIRKALLKYLYEREMFILQSGISNLSKNQELRISYASHILCSENAKFSQILILLTNLTEKNASLFTSLKRRILLQGAENSLQGIFQERREGVLDIKSFVDFQNDKFNFLQLLISNTQKYIEFWSHYKQPSFLLTKLIQINTAMEQEASIIGKKWALLLGEHKQFFFQSVSPHYCAYLDLVRNLPYKALKTAQKPLCQENHAHFGYKERELVNKKTLGLEDTLVFYVSLQKDKKEKILFSSANIYSLLCHKRADLIGKDFETLLPASLVRGYKRVLGNYLDAASEQKNHLELSLYIKNKLNFVLPCSVYITLYPYIHQEPAYVVIMRPKEIKSEFLLSTPDGQVDAYSEKIGKILNLKASLHTFIADIYTQARSLAGRGNSKIQSQILLENLSRGGGSQSRVLEDPQLTKSIAQSEDKQDWIEADLTPQGFQGDNERSAKKYLVKTLPQYLGEEKYYKILIKPSNQASYKTFTTAAAIGTCAAAAKGYAYEPAAAEAFRDQRRPTLKQLDFLTTDPYQQPEILSSPTSADQLFTSTNRKEASFVVDHSSSPHQLLPRKLSMKLLFNQNFENEDPATIFSPNNNQNLDNTHPEEEEETSHFDNLPSRRHKIARSDKASSGETSLTAGAKLEQAIYSIPPSNLKRWITIISYIFMIICIGSLVFFVIYEENNLTMIQDNTSSLRTFALRLVELLMLVEDVQSIRLLQAGLITDERDAYLNLSLLNETLFSDISEEKNSLYNLNNLLRNSMNQIDSSLQKDFYKLLVPLLIYDTQVTVMYLNTFDTVVELVTKSDNILGEKTLSTVQDQDIDFIIDNSLNELLLNSELIDDYLIQDSQLIFTRTRKLALGFLLAILTIAVLLIISLLSQQKKLIDERDKFLTLFLYTDEAVTNQVLTQIKIFEDTLVNDRLENKGPVIIKGQRKEKRALTSALKIDYKSRARIKSSDSTGLNLKHLQIFGLGIFLLIFLIIPFIMILIVSDNKNNDLDLQIDTINELNNDFYEMSLLLTSFYDYILNNGTTSIRTRPIEQEWPKILAANIDSQNFLFGLIQSVEKENTCSQATYTLINQLIYGNLCELVSTDTDTESLCLEIASGGMKKGIQGVNNYFLYTLSNLKDQFVYSHRSFQDAKETLSSQDLIELEVIVNLWYHDAYIMLERALETCTIEYIETTHDSERQFLAAYLVVDSVVVMIIVYYMTKWIEIERTGWRMLFRKIPREVVLSNKMLKNYLVIENRNILKLE